MLLDAQEIGRPANAKRRELRERSPLPKLDVELREAAEKFGIANAHDAWDAPFRVKPSARRWRG